MSDQTVEQLRRMGACEEGRESTGPYPTIGDWWMATNNLDWMLWLCRHIGLADGPAMRLYAVWCVRQVQHLMTDPRSIAALDVAERHAAGNATDKDLAVARDAADAADAARAAAWAAADAAWAARAAARAAAWAAADAAWAARAAALSAQRDKLREIFPASQINRMFAIACGKGEG